MKTLLIDNYDSYSYILYQYLWEINGEKPYVVKNDGISLVQLQRMDFDNIVISPGPGHPAKPRDFGICADVLKAFSNTPILGVCLGHQGMGCFAGASVVHAPEVKHGRYSNILHRGDSELFAGIPSPFRAVRYHSLVVERITCPDQVEILAESEDDNQIMSLKIQGRPYYGVQFHPESIGTEHGKLLLENFRSLTHRWKGEGSGKPQTKDGRATSKLPFIRETPPFAPQTSVRELAWRDPEAAFSHFFLPSPGAFWLDGDGHASKHTSADIDADRETRRFSYMGDGRNLIETRGNRVVFKSMRSEDNSFFLKQKLEGNPLHILKSYMDRRRIQSSQEANGVGENAWPFEFTGGLVGYLGYELREFLGGRTAGKITNVENAAIPESLLIEADRLLVFDWDAGRVFAAYVDVSPRQRHSHVGDGGARAWFAELESAWEGLRPLEVPVSMETPTETNIGANTGVGADLEDFLEGGGWDGWHLSVGKEEYLERIQSIKSLIRDGEAYEVCLTNEFASAEVPGNPFHLYRILRRINPAPYSAFLKFPHACILSSSPERFLKLDKNGELSSKPIKGTRSRGVTDAEDAKLRADLAGCEKDLAENLMITDLMRNDLGKVCAQATVSVPRMMEVEGYATVFQLVSEIRGQMAPEFGALDAVAACFPGGSMTGAPKLRAMEIIADMEKRPRGVFSGALGFLAYNGSMDLSIVIRTLLIEPGRISVGCGGAIVADSDPEAEFREAMLKAYALLKAVRLARADENRT